jgi:uncharacterized repeat protein (TIGR02543 family)
MANWINTSGGWKEITNIWINTVSGWKEAVSGFINTANSGWQLFWGGAGQPDFSNPAIDRVTISISGTTNRTVDWINDAPILVGTNYNWTNYSSGTYYFQKAVVPVTGDPTWVTMGSPTNFNVNPTTSAQYTRTLTEDDFPEGANTIFRFVVTVTNTAVTPNKTTTSYSTWINTGTLTGYVRVNYPRPKGIPGSPTIVRDTDNNYKYNITGYGSYYNNVTITSNIVSWETSDDITNTSFPIWTVRNTDNLPYPADTYKGKYLRLGVKGSNSYGQASDFIYSSATLIYYKTPSISSFTVTGLTNQITYSYNYAADDPNRNFKIFYKLSSSNNFTSYFVPNVQNPYESFSPGTYDFKLRVENTASSGNSLYAEYTVSGITVSAIVYPDPPTITSHTQTSTSITLNFNKGNNSTITRAYKYINSTLVYDGATTGTSYTFSGLSPSTSYNLRLFGYDGTNESSGYAGGNYSTDAAPPTVYTIKYYGNTSDGGTMSDGSYTSGGTAYTIAANSFTKTNYTFVNWNTAANGTGTTYLPGASYSTNANLNLYAQWTVAQYTVTWNVSINGGSGGGSTTQNAGTAHTAPSPGTKTGYSFSGYYDTPSGDYAYGPIASGGSFTPPSSITMYTRWSAAAPSGGTASISGTAASGSTLTLNTTDPNAGQPVTSTSITWQRNSGTSGAWVTARTYGTSYVLGSSDISYSIRVVIVWSNAYGNQTITTNQIGPIGLAALTGLDVKSYTSGSFSITWNSVYGAGSYAVTVGGPNGISTSTTNTSYSISGLLSFTGYFIQVVPYSGTSGNGTAGEGQSVSGKYPDGSNAVTPFFPPFFPPSFPFFPPFFPPSFPFFPPFFPPSFPSFTSTCPPDYFYGVVCCSGFCSDPACFPNDFIC